MDEKEQQLINEHDRVMAQWEQDYYDAIDDPELRVKLVEIKQLVKRLGFKGTSSYQQ